MRQVTGGQGGARRARLTRAWTAWLLALAGVGILLGALDYRSRDPDSTLYTEIAVSLVDRPVDQWVAPRWVNYVGDDDLFREHPAGLFWPPALLARLGYPREQSAYFINAIYQVLSILLFAALASRFVPAGEARALMWALTLLPIAFVFRIRANHEQAVLVCTLLAAYATDRARIHSAWHLLTTAALGGLFLVKGVLVLPGLAVCGWLLVVRDLETGGRLLRDWRPWAGLVGGAVAVVALVAVYEAWYRAATGGESFLGFYLPRQMGASFDPAASGGINLLNVPGYAARVAWFAFPWSLVAVVAAWRVRGSLTTFARGGAGERADGAGIAGLVFALGAAAIYVVAFGLSDRIAERYIFPAYFFAGGAGVVAAIHGWPRFRALVERLDAYHPWVPVLVWLGAIVLRTATLWLPRVGVYVADG